ncbi:MAG: HIT domain-containing protein [Planctomycetes bacterium]|nr:HIT domain-containing protein [Planctomycetota bacterium]
MDYIRSLGDELQEEGCFLCKYWSDPTDDSKNHVVWRRDSTFAVMNRFPYSNGHMLVAHSTHKAELGELADDELATMTRTIRDVVAVLRETLSPNGFNVGFNLGRCAGAGLPGHIHAHVVPRWNGDTNFMAVLADIRVVPDSLDALYGELVATARKLGLIGK